MNAQHTPTVTRADRDAAWPFRPDWYDPEYKPAWDEGLYDANPTIQRFARHREQSQAELLEALSRLLAYWSGGGDQSAFPNDMQDDDELEAFCRAAIAKARGVQP